MLLIHRNLYLRYRYLSLEILFCFLFCSSMPHYLSLYMTKYHREYTYRESFNPPHIPQTDDVYQRYAIYSPDGERLSKENAVEFFQSTTIDDSMSLFPFTQCSAVHSSALLDALPSLCSAQSSPERYVIYPTCVDYTVVTVYRDYYALRLYDNKYTREKTTAYSIQPRDSFTEISDLEYQNIPVPSGNKSLSSLQSLCTTLQQPHAIPPCVCLSATYIVPLGSTWALEAVQMQVEHSLFSQFVKPKAHCFIRSSLLQPARRNIPPLLLNFLRYSPPRPEDIQKKSHTQHTY